MAKKIKTKIKLQIAGGQANPAPPVGPALGQHGLNIAGFCKDFNDRTKDKMGDIIPVEITVYEDRSYDFILKTSPASELIKKAAGIKKGSGKPLTEKAGLKISLLGRGLSTGSELEYADPETIKNALTNRH